MKNAVSIFFSVVLLIVLWNCEKKEDEPVNPNPSLGKEITKAGLIKTSEKWTSDTLYILSGRVIIPNGVTLTIEPGTIIKGKEGDGSLASALVIARGGKLMAEGTADKPIIFTSTLDNIKIGEKKGTNLDFEDVGLWGGVIVLGKASVSVAGGETQIEGIPSDIQEGKYGGGASPVDDDNSGIIRYVSIRHGGTLIGANNEINGLTLGGVGSGTVIENVEVVANKDDGVEWFGGTVHVKNILVWAQQDDAFDIDQAYSGTITNIVYIAGPKSDHGLEIDGPEGTQTGSFTLQKGSFKGMSGEYADFRDGATGTVKEIYFFNYDSSSDIELDADGSDAGDGKKNSDNPETSDNFAGEGFAYTGDLIITDLEFNAQLTDGKTAMLENIFVDKWSEASFLDGDVRDEAFAMDRSKANAQKFIDANKIVTEKEKAGADIVQFGWTYAHMEGVLEGF